VCCACRVFFNHFFQRRLIRLLRDAMPQPKNGRNGGIRRFVVNLYDTVYDRIDSIVYPVVEAADRYMMGVHDITGMQVIYWKGKRADLHARVAGIQVGVVHGAHRLLDRSDALVDRLLPLDEVEERVKLAKATKVTAVALIPRTLGLPLKFPIRITRVVFVKAGACSESVVELSAVYKNKLTRRIAQGRHKITDQVGCVTSPAIRKVQVLRQSLADGQEVVVVWVGGKLYVVASHLRLPAIKEWAVSKSEGLKLVCGTAMTRSTETAFAATSRLIGDDRAVVIFDKFHVYIPQAKQPVAEGIELSKQSLDEAVQQQKQVWEDSTAKKAGQERSRRHAAQERARKVFEDAKVAAKENAKPAAPEKPLAQAFELQYSFRWKEEFGDKLFAFGISEAEFDKSLLRVRDVQGEEVEAGTDPEPQQFPLRVTYQATEQRLSSRTPC